jgi:hypothetical protein
MNAALLVVALLLGHDATNTGYCPAGQYVTAVPWFSPPTCAPASISGTLPLSQLPDDDVNALGARVLINGGPSSDPSWGQVSAALIAPGAIDWSKFAAGVRPMLLTATNPTLPDTAYPLGTVIYNTTTASLLKSSGSTWDPMVTSSDIAANAITAGKINAGGVTAGNLAANAVVAGNIAAGAVTTSTMTANSISGDRIQAGTITGDRIAAGTITANTFVANYTPNLWPNGTSEIAPPAGMTVDPADPEFGLRSGSGAARGVGVGRVIVAPTNTVAGLYRTMGGVAQNDSFTITASLESYFVGCSVGVRIEYLDWNGTVVATYNSPSTTSTTWTSQTVTSAPAPWNAWSVRFGLIVNACAAQSNTGAFDDIVANRVITGSAELGAGVVTRTQIAANAVDIGQLADSGWIVVGSGGSAPAFQNSTVNYGSGWQPARFRKIGGVVYIQGMVTGVTGLNLAMWTMPVGFRPAGKCQQTSLANNTQIITVLPTGEVEVYFNNSTSGPFSVVTSYPADQ